MELDATRKSNPTAATEPEDSDADLTRIVAEEETCLQRVSAHLQQRRAPVARTDSADYDARLLDLRDQIGAARMEDVPPLVQEMERLQALASRLREIEEVPIDLRSPYFGRLVLEESGRKREVLIGRGTHLDTKAGIRIVDWRDAPVSRLYYRYEEGNDYDEVFGEREISGTVVTRRSVTIAEAVLRRIGSPQGTFVRKADGEFRRVDTMSSRLTGGAGQALRANQHHRPGKLGIGQEGGEDRHLKEITALIDPRQFDLITRPESGLVVIQGGAGSGKTTIGLHRLAFLAFRDSRRFRPDRMLVIVFNDALVRYIAEVLPALGIHGVLTRTYTDWAAKIRQGLYPRLPRRYRDDTPSVVTRMKKHPAMLRGVQALIAERTAEIDTELEQAMASEGDAGAGVLAGFRRDTNRPLGHRLHALGLSVTGDAGRSLSTNARIAAERIGQRGLRHVRDVAQAWGELLTDRDALGRLFEREAPGAFTKGELDRAHAWCVQRTAEALAEADTDSDREESFAPPAERPREGEGEREGASARERSERRERSEDERSERRRDRDESARPRRRERDDDNDNGHELRAGIDGAELTERARLDVEDDALILLLHQGLRGPLTRAGMAREPIVYEHILVDEAQDLSPVELAVVLGTSSKAKSVTLSGDVQQRVLLDNGFSDWNTVLGELGFAHIEIEPLKLSYRSTSQIVDFSRYVLGPLASPDAPEATRTGAPVELFRFGHIGDAVAFLAETLRELVQSEPGASVAVIARFPEQADAYYDGLKRGEVPNLRRVAEQDFTFRPGVDVTDVRQVKGLEFDYVILVEATDSAYPDDDEARHLLHVGATRAAYQLWVTVSGKPSPLLPQELIDRAL
jgi:DNA helicase-2/ATP-dependent DNA helicase PcrA